MAMLKRIGNLKFFRFPIPNSALFQLESAGVELIILAFLFDQLLVVAAFDDLAVLQHHDHV